MKNDPPNKKLTYRHFLLKIPRLIDETPCIYTYLLFEGCDLLQCFFATCSCFKHFINRNIYIYINIYIDIYTCMCIYMCMCVCVCVCVCGCVCVCLCVCASVLVLVYVFVTVCCGVVWCLVVCCACWCV